MSEYKTMNDLDGCPGESCPLADFCDWSGKTCPPPELLRDPPCSMRDGDELVDNVLAELEDSLRRREDIEDKRFEAKKLDEERKAAIQAKRRATLAKNRVKNRERAQDRKRVRMIKALARQRILSFEDAEVIFNHIEKLLGYQKLSLAFSISIKAGGMTLEAAREKLAPYEHELRELREKVAIINSRRRDEIVSFMKGINL